MDESNDVSRPVAPSDDKHTLTIKDVAQRYSEGGHPRTIRTLQRYCEAGHLDAIKTPTELGDLYLITPESVERHIAQLDEIAATTQFATGRDEPRPVATDVAEKMSNDTPDQIATTIADTSRRDATDRDESRVPSSLETIASTDDNGSARRPTMGDQSRPVATETAHPSSRYIVQLESENNFLRGQILVKDTQIKDLTERARETNHLIAGLQRMLSPLLGTRRDQSEIIEHDAAGSRPENDAASERVV